MGFYNQISGSCVFSIKCCWHSNDHGV